MSANEYTQTEQKSSIAVTQNAKGDAQVSVKIYDGADEDEVTRIRELAVAAYRDTVTEIRQVAA